jgi:hypothetical protein
MSEQNQRCNTSSICMAVAAPQSGGGPVGPAQLSPMPFLCPSPLTYATCMPQKRGQTQTQAYILQYVPPKRPSRCPLEPRDTPHLPPGTPMPFQLRRACPDHTPHTGKVTGSQHTVPEPPTFVTTHQKQAQGNCQWFCMPPAEW